MKRRPQRRFDLRLKLLLELHLSTLEKYKQLDEIRDQHRLSRLQELNANIRATHNQEARWALEHELEALKEATEIPVTFGLYFPQQHPQKCAHYSALDTPFISAILTSRLTPDELEQLGMELRSSTGIHHTAFIPYNQLATLLEHPGIYAIELAHPGPADPTACMLFQAEPNGPHRLVGVLNTEERLPEHPYGIINLVEEGLMNRIPRMWDQTPSSDSPVGTRWPNDLPYGREFRLPDRVSEGAASMAFVRLPPPRQYIKTDNTFLLDGIAYLVRYAKTRGLTCDHKRCLFELGSLVEQSLTGQGFLKSLFTELIYSPPTAETKREATEGQEKVEQTYDRPADASVSRNDSSSSSNESIASNSG